MYLQSSLILVVSVTLATGQQKSYNDPIEPGQNYCKTIEEAVNYLRGREILEDINLDFLRDIAYVETKDGERLVTTNDTINRGLWNINEKQRSYLNNTVYCEKVRDILGNEFTCGSMTSYEQPISAATAALAYIIIALFDFDDNKINKNLVSTMFNNNSSWQLYRLYSNNTNVSQEWFDNKTRALRDPTEQYCFSCENIESKGDVIVLMDSSGSVGDGNFEIAKRFMVNLASHLNLGPYKFGVITYSHLCQDTYSVPLSDDIGHLNDSIMAIPYTGGGTLTGAAIYHAVSKFEPDSGFKGRSKDKGVNRILIVATDGRSGDSVSEPSEYASNNSIEVFSIGIGSNVNEEELRTIAKEPHHVFHVDTYEHLFQLSLVIQTATCRSRVHISPTNGSESLHLNITEDKVFFAQIMISESRLQECNNEGKNAINLNITVINGEIVVYGSFEIEFPDSKNYDYNWTIGSGQNVSPQFEVNTHDHCSGSKRRRQIDNDNQVFYMAIQSGNTSVTLDIDTSIGPLNEENLLAVIVTKVTDTEAEGLLSYHCIANCTCPDAYVVWERDSINPALPTAAKAVTSSNNRETTLNLFTNTLGYSGGFYCYIRSPSVIGTFGERIEVNLKCQNGHAINNIYCLCDPGWRGDFCGQGIYMHMHLHQQNA